MSKESSSFGKEARLLVKWTVVSLASSGDSESEGGLTPPPLKRARLSVQHQTGEPSFIVSDHSALASLSSSSASSAHPSTSTNSSGSMSGPSRLSSKPDPQQQQTNGVTLENVDSGRVSAMNGDSGLVNGVGTTEEDGEIATEGLERHSSRVRKRPQRQLTGMDADIVRLVGQHLREMGFK